MENSETIGGEGNEMLEEPFCTTLDSGGSE